MTDQTLTLNWRGKARGFTLTELAIVLGIIGLILGAIWVAASKVYANNRAERAIGQVLQILGGYRSLFGAHGVDTGGGGLVDITCMGVNAGIFPSDMLLPGVTCTTGNYATYPRSPWGGEVVGWGDQPHNGISIGYYTIPQSACIAMAMAEANAPDLLFSYVGTSWAGPNYMLYPPYGNAARMTSMQINTFCQPSNDEATFGYAIR